MTRDDFSRLRDRLGKTQKELAQLLGASVKAVQSFEQGWRKVPIHVERQILLLVALQAQRGRKSTKSCWQVKDCPPATRNTCPAREFGAGNLCWLINGTVCHGEPQKSWQRKMALCRKCQVFQSMFAPV